MALLPLLFLPKFPNWADNASGGVTWGGGESSCWQPEAVEAVAVILSISGCATCPVGNDPHPFTKRALLLPIFRPSERFDVAPLIFIFKISILHIHFLLDPASLSKLQFCCCCCLYVFFFTMGFLQKVFYDISGHSYIHLLWFIISLHLFWPVLFQFGITVGPLGGHKCCSDSLQNSRKWSLAQTLERTKYCWDPIELKSPLLWWWNWLYLQKNRKQ
jgi:hypothetical protein